MSGQEQGMARNRFYYFLPGTTPKVSQKRLTAAGIHHFKEADVRSYTGTQIKGREGVVFILDDDTGAVNRPAREPELFTWYVCNGGAFMIGVELGYLPTPQTLSRVSLLSSYTVTLGDGHKWAVPVARIFPEGTHLPEALCLMESGEFGRRVLPEYEAYLDATEEFLHWFAVDQKDPELVTEYGLRPRQAEDLTRHSSFVDDRSRMEFIALALGLNYRVSLWEVGILRLATTDNFTTVGLVSVDYFEFAEVLLARAEALKKKESATTPPGSDTCAGGAVSV